MTDDRKDGERKVPSWQLPKERQPETDAYHIWTPRPLLRSIYWKPDPPPPHDVVSSTYEVFIDQRAWLTMHEHVWQTPGEKTPFGYLVGDLCEDPNANRRFINITAALPARFDFREEEREQISREATLALQLEVERRRGVLAGWYHRHLGGSVAMSEADVRTHHKHFAEPWQCAFLFVAQNEGCEGGCFRSSPEAFAGDLLLPFYEMASNESLLARGVKRSYLDWSNYTTVDEILAEPPPRPTIEIPEEPDEASEETDEELELAPFDADPDELDAAVAEEPEAAVDAEPVEDVAATEAAGAEGVSKVDREEEIDEEATAAEREDTEEEIDLDAAINEVTPARIELDLEPEPDAEDAAEVEDVSAGEGEALEAKEAEPSQADAVVGETEENRPASTTAVAEPSWIRRLTTNRRLAGMVAGGILLLAVAVAVAAFVLLRGTNEAGEAGAEGAPVATEPGATGEAPGAAPDAGADSVEIAGVTAAQVDSAGRDMLQAISRFYGRAVARDRGEATCDELAAAFIAVEDAWIRYNTEFKGEFEGPLPDRLAQRDERLYAGVQDAEREFELSECPRP